MLKVGQRVKVADNVTVSGDLGGEAGVIVREAVPATLQMYQVAFDNPALKTVHGDEPLIDDGIEKVAIWLNDYELLPEAETPS